MNHSYKPSLLELTFVCLKIGFLSFGGPTAQIALMHKMLVEEKQWLDEQQYLRALSFCMLLPGPEAMQLSIYIGWRLHRVLGGLITGLLFVLPGAVIMLLLALLYTYFGNTAWLEAAFIGVKSVILVVVIEALVRLSKKALLTKKHWCMAAFSFLGLFFLDLPFPLVILIAGVFGFFTAKPMDEIFTHNEPLKSLRKTFVTAFVWLAIWLVPLFILGHVTEWGFLFDLGVFFAKLATVTFGGAYAVLAYMSQEVVFAMQWLNTAQMMDGLGLAETTPGPLILVAEFVGFMTGMQVAGLGTAIMAALVVLWVTFVPCFLWIFVGAPYLEWITAQPRLKNALATIVAAVVGVILSLSIWFGLHVFFTEVNTTKLSVVHIWWPNISSVNWLVVGLAMVSYYLLQIKKINLLSVLGLCAVLSIGAIA